VVGNSNRDEGGWSDQQRKDMACSVDKRRLHLHPSCSHWIRAGDAVVSGKGGLREDMFF